MPPKDLPVELCIMIVQEVANKGDLKSLLSISRTCRYLYSIANPILYKWNVQHDDSSALRWAIEHHRVDTLKWLMENGASVDQLISGKSPLMMAVISNSVNVVRYFLTLSGVDWNWATSDGTTALQEAIRRDATRIVRLLLTCKDVSVDAKSHAGYTALALAALKKEPPVLAKLLLARGANPDSRTNRGESPLCFAIAFGNLKLVRRLLDTRRVDINVVPEDGLPPLIGAVYWKRPKILKLLLSRSDIDVNISPKTGQRNGQTALSLAVQKGYMELVLMLLEHPKTDPDKVDADSQTALTRAANKKEIDNIMMSVLLGDSRVGNVIRKWLKRRYNITK